jgi:hypothetical protein
MDVCRQIPLIF